MDKVYKRKIFYKVIYDYIFTYTENLLSKYYSNHLNVY